MNRKSPINKSKNNSFIKLIKVKEALANTSTSLVQFLSKLEVLCSTK